MLGCEEAVFKVAKRQSKRRRVPYKENKGLFRKSRFNCYSPLKLKGAFGFFLVNYVVGKVKVEGGKGG